MVYVSITPTQCIKIGSQQRLESYVHFDLLFTIRYLETLTRNVFTTYLEDCSFNEKLFSPLKREKLILE